MREKLKTLPLTTLREMAKNVGIKSVTTLRKNELIDALVEANSPKLEEAALTEKITVEKKSVETAPAPVQKATVKKTSAQKSVKEKKSDSDSNDANPPHRDLSSHIKAMRKREEKAERPDRNERSDRNDRPDRSDRIERTDRNDRFDRNDYQERVPVHQDRGDSQQEDEKAALDSGNTVSGILEVMADGYGFIRSDNYMPGENDVYVAPSQIRRFNLKTGDIVEGNTRIKTQSEKFQALLYVKKVNGGGAESAIGRMNFEDMTPIFPSERIKLERGNNTIAMRMMDIISPVGKGQRGMIVAPPKAGKTTLLKQIATAVTRSNPEIHMIILLIDERPEEVTDIKESIQSPNVEVIYSTFDELPEHHKRVSEMVIERARRLVEQRHDVMILLDSITRLARAYNLTVPPSGRTLSGGLDPAALHMPKRFFGAARNMREGGSLTILATALVETGSKMDDVVYEEFKGTGNMELVLNRKLQEKRVFPAIDLPKSGTRRDDLLLSRDEINATEIIHRAVNGARSEDAVEKLIDMFAHTRSNNDFMNLVVKSKL